MVKRPGIEKRRGDTSGGSGGVMDIPQGTLLGKKLRQRRQAKRLRIAQVVLQWKHFPCFNRMMFLTAPKRLTLLSCLIFQAVVSTRYSIVIA